MKLLLALAAMLTALVQPVPPQDPVDQVAQAVAQGMAAEQANNGRAMLAAARRLEALNARPDTPDGDLAQHWRERARARGVIDRQPPVRGRALGPAYRRGVLQPGQAIATQQVFLAGQKAEVALVPQPGRSLAIRIAAPDQQICDQAANPPRAVCSWLPIFTHRVEIRVTNASATAANYYLVSN